jgi:hypothetical protein
LTLVAARSSAVDEPSIRISLGHAVLYGVGAYSSGLLAIGGWHEAVTDAIFGGAVAALLAAIAGPFILRLKGLPLINRVGLPTRPQRSSIRVSRPSTGRSCAGLF